MSSEPLFMNVVNGFAEMSPVAKTLGWKFIKYNSEEKEVHVEFEASDSLANPIGCIQGGVLSAMLDDSMGPAIYITMPQGKVAITIESKTNFVNAAYPGKIYGRGRIAHAKSSIIFTSGELFNEAGDIIATATATFKVFPFEVPDSTWKIVS
jgi:uncharacterized protein (TIGR00369 family)